MEASCSCQAQRPALGMLQKGLWNPWGITLLPGSAGMPEQAGCCKGTATYRKDDSLQLLTLLILSAIVTEP